MEYKSPKKKIARMHYTGKSSFNNQNSKLIYFISKSMPTFW